MKRLGEFVIIDIPYYLARGLGAALWWLFVQGRYVVWSWQNGWGEAWGDKEEDEGPTDEQIDLVTGAIKRFLETYGPKSSC